MWRVESGAHLLPPLPVDRLDRLYPVDQLKSSKTSFVDGRDSDFDHFTCKAPPISRILDPGPRKGFVV